VLQGGWGGLERSERKIEMTESRHGSDWVFRGAVWLATVDSVTANRRKKTMADLCDDYGLMGFGMFPYYFIGKLHNKLVAPVDNAVDILYLCHLQG
jgi:hypothetical protein